MSNLITKHSGVISTNIKTTISYRYKIITKAINNEFWESSSDSLHSMYVGSYGRRTAVNTSDVDILVEIPKTEYERYDYSGSNGQSRFLQAVKKSIQVAYPRSNIRADGQIIKVNFSDGIYFEILPTFRNEDWYGNVTYTYPDTNMGGNWKSSNPKAEIEAMQAKNNTSNGLLNATCRHFRYIRDTFFSSYHLSGIVIDSFVYAAMGNWKYLDTGESGTSSRGDYEKKLNDYLLSHSQFGTLTLSAPGSNQSVDTDSSLECLKKVMSKILE